MKKNSINNLFDKLESLEIFVSVIVGLLTAGAVVWKLVQLALRSGYFAGFAM